MDEIVESFKKINSETTFEEFIARLNLVETLRNGNDAQYGGVVNGLQVLLEEHSWDPSQVFNMQKDEFSVSLIINNQQVGVVRFTGEV